MSQEALPLKDDAPPVPEVKPELVRSPGRRIMVLLAVALVAALLLLLASVEKPAEAAFPGQNGKIAFVSDRDGDSEIYTMNTDGSNPINLTNNSVGDGDPAWSPDGTRIAYAGTAYSSTQTRYPQPEIHVMDADGSDQISIPAPYRSEPWDEICYGPASERSPAWSPDGTRIAFVSNRDGSGEDCTYSSGIFTMNPDGSDQTRVVSAYRVSPQELAWSPDGTKIAYVGSFDDFTGTGIFTVNADGSNPFSLVSALENGSYSPSWSPDGTKIAFASSGDIYTMNADGSDPTNITNTSGISETRPAWSPDGNRITFAGAIWNAEARRLDDFEIYTMNADGTNQIRLTDNEAVDTSPDWQPLSGPALPTTKAQCKHGGYEEFGFKNQGRCVAYVQKRANSE